MNSYNGIVTTIEMNVMGKCKYHSKCEYYDKEGRTCRKLGGRGCGKKMEKDYLSSFKKDRQRDREEGEIIKTYP